MVVDFLFFIMLKVTLNWLTQKVSLNAKTTQFTLCAKFAYILQLPGRLSQLNISNDTSYNIKKSSYFQSDWPL